MTNKRPSKEQLLGGIYGLLVGDALGVPYEFSEPWQLPPIDQLEFEPPRGFNRAHVGVPSGSWSDDGAQALCLLASLLHHDRLDLEDLGRRFRNWLRNGYLAVGGKVFDVGIQTSKAIERLEAGSPADESGPAGEWDNGNGSLMRVLPLALWHQGNDRALFDAACHQSMVTHGHPRSQICCGLYCLWARREWQGSPDSWSSSVETVSRLIAGRHRWQSEFGEKIEPHKPPGGGGSGYVVDCLHSARLALEEGSFERVTKAAVALGNDTDTTAAVAGGIAGIRFGYSSIPNRWLDALQDRLLVEPLVSDLLGSWG